MEKDSVPLKYARTMLNVAEAQGYNLNTLVVSLNSPIDILDPDIDPNTPVPSQVYTNIFNYVMWLLQDESFGLGLKQKAHTGTFRMMCLTIIHCNNLEQAMRRAAEFNAFCRTLSGENSAFDINPIYRLEDGTAEYLFPSNNELLDQESADNIITMAHCVAIWRRFCGWLIGKNIELVQVNFQTSAPKNISYLQQLFKCDLHFEQPANSFRFPANYLLAPLVHTEDSLKEFLRNAPYHLLASNEEDEKSILSQMKRIIGNDFSRDFLSVVEMANHLHMSVRTLRRRLKDVGTTYQQFKDDLRCNAAKSYLSRPELKINAVSALLGFDEPSAFHRSFKKWTGMTPGEFRSNQQQEPN
ncbi:AraC family transcriptional regulator [Oceanicoccus sp. KOV_DT_Chl]|uniref:AraC family transcriptional regulator n=1 Tax=Oceanicoccus sp. KOV_DT_Chl TaxID=1904639 RepID=UPI000C7E20B3|nr:AraC family transcriptional regulator [Oceanicoccus sp. KOV_DT_Chl]